MCDVKRYEALFKEMMELSPEDTAEIILESDDEEVKKFYGYVGNLILKKRQQKVIEERLF